MIFADASSLDPLVTGLAGLLTGGGFALWLARHLILNTIPEMQKQHAAALAAKSLTMNTQALAHAGAVQDLTSAAATALAKVTDASATALAKVTANHREDTRDLWAATREMETHMITSVDRMATELRHADNNVRAAGYPGIMNREAED